MRVRSAAAPPLVPPENDAQSGKYRRITVQLLVPAGLPKLHVYSLNGYFVPER